MSKKATMGHMARLMDGVMTGSKARVAGVPKGLVEHRLTSDEIADIGRKVKLVNVPGKGLGIVARKNLPVHTPVGTYGGTMYTSKMHEQLVKRGLTTGKYSVDHYRIGKDGKVRDTYVMDPGSGAGNHMHPKHANVLAAFINEPSGTTQPNAVWVRNYNRGTLELWTTRAIAAGEELTVCYGDDYPRNYTTICKTRPGLLHRVGRGAKVPVPI